MSSRDRNGGRSTTVPPVWRAEFRKQFLSELGLRDALLRPSLVFTVFPAALDARLGKQGITQELVLAELAEGFQLHRKDEDKHNRPTYRLRTDRLDIWVHTEEFRGDESVRLAVLDNAVRLRRRQPRVGEWIVPETVTFGEVYAGNHCDLEGLQQSALQLRRLAEAESALTKLRLTPERHSDLRDEVRRQYGSLRSLMTLVELRAKSSAKVTATGTVVAADEVLDRSAPRAGGLAVVLDRSAALQWAEGVRLNLTPEVGGRAVPVRVVHFGDDVLLLERPRRGTWEPGTRVVVTETDDFRFSRHLAALHEFMDERVVGNWTTLATLLCHPGNLGAPTSLPPVESPRLPLNSEQKRAVAGALAAPHAFFIQGPPGTGKTQVITELVSRLTRRGERVLLTAPTHVALDEVLRRLNEEPGVLPIRLSWNDDLVATDLRHLTRSGFREMASSALDAVSDGRAARWRAQRDRVEARRKALLRWRNAHDAYRAARGDLGVIESECTARSRIRARERVRLFETLAGRRRRVARQADLISDVERDLDRHLSSPQPTGVISRLLTTIGLGTTGRRRRAVEALRRRSRVARQEYLVLATEFDTALAEHDSGTVEADTEERHDTATLGAARDRLDQAGTDLNDAAVVLAEVGMAATTADPAGVPSRLTELTREAALLEAKVQLQQRWFDLLGTGGAWAGEQQATAALAQGLSGAVNLVCSTTTGFGGDPYFRDLDYDTLVVDEASKVTSAEFLIPARKARRWVLVGDEKQLRPYVEPVDEHHLHALAALHLSDRDERLDLGQAVDRLAEIWKRYDDEELHQFRTRSVLEEAERMVVDGSWQAVHREPYTNQVSRAPGGGEPERWLLETMHRHLVSSVFERSVTRVDIGLRQRLVEQRRMVAELAELVRHPVYGGDYRTAPVEALVRASVTPLVSGTFPKPLTFLDTAARRPTESRPGGSTSFVNEVEAELVADVCRHWERELRNRNDSGITVSVLTMYGAQAHLVRRLLGHPHYPAFTKLAFQVVDSVDRIQGQQSDLVIVSFCRTSGVPRSVPRLSVTWGRWLQNVNRLNVACTRARRALVLVGHQPTLKRLAGVPASEAFYTNLFKLIDRGRATLITDFVHDSPRSRR
ncbi:DEAD/DEAH box helicase [Saccharothrix sp. NRRL B-16314]|uniref:DEAD/DEAH box helicase n=1 Tax=Saccharothrix sp. NRRL B-16314 TaxID=1463825 RepID=UPI000526C652|nr:AAA domain-containing protein [Saccharothrix sp. NRRL B-16314]